jgi:NAD(P)-dependent dehydrogenase (short-subunit alcohol dehydrogenase family)
MTLSGKVVVVTGAESGIGRAISLACGAEGASVVAAGLMIEKLHSTADEIRKRGAMAVAVHTDISNPESVRNLFEVAQHTFGKIDAAVANAGITGEQSPAIDLTLENWKRIIEVNLTGTFLTVTAAARILVRQGDGGSILATGSSSALKPVAGLAGYAASKGGVHAMMHALAVELAPHRIRVNTLVPGTTSTEATRNMSGYLERVAQSLPLGSVVEADELGRYAAFVLGDSLPHLTGSQLKLDAGRTL